MNLLKINDKIINMDRVAVVKRQENNTVWINFQGSEKGNTDQTLTPDEGAKLWAYLLTLAPDVMESNV